MHAAIWKLSLPKVGMPLAAALTAIAVAGVAAQGLPPTHAQIVNEGQVLAERLCTSCHVVDAGQGGTAQAGVPTFRGMANKPGQSAEHIRFVLINPHPPMPDVRLSNPEIDRLIAYIDSLRSEKSGPPLIPRRPTGGKPVYPDPT